jgi:hypothetical protein
MLGSGIPEGCFDEEEMVVEDEAKGTVQYTV